MFISIRNSSNAKLKNQRESYSFLDFALFPVRPILLPHPLRVLNQILESLLRLEHLEYLACPRRTEDATGQKTKHGAIEQCWLVGAHHEVIVLENIGKIAEVVNAQLVHCGPEMKDQILITKRFEYGNE